MIRQFKAVAQQHPMPEFDSVPVQLQVGATAPLGMKQFPRLPRILHVPDFLQPHREFDEWDILVLDVNAVHLLVVSGPPGVPAMLHLPQIGGIKGKLVGSAQAQWFDPLVVGRDPRSPRQECVAFRSGVGVAAMVPAPTFRTCVGIHVFPQ